MKNIIIVILLVLVCFAGIFYLYNRTLAPVSPVACTTEAMICPGGSLVGRVGPNCEFALCPKANVPEDSIACTQEARECPDGSFVGRSGPKCEFAPCPNMPVKDGTTASLNQRILSNGVYITPVKVESDSRCPIDVRCIWAGEVTLKVKLEKGGTSKEVTIKQDVPFAFQGSEVSLVGVSPENEAGKPFTQEAYRFTFKVK